MSVKDEIEKQAFEYYRSMVEGYFKDGMDLDDLAVVKTAKAFKAGAKARDKMWKAEMNRHLESVYHEVDYTTYLELKAMVAKLSEWAGLDKE